MHTLRLARWRRHLSPLLMIFCILMAGCEGEQPSATQPSGSTGNEKAQAPVDVETPRTPKQSSTKGVFEPPEVDLSEATPALAMKIGAARSAVRTAPDDAQKVGQLGALYYAHGFYGESSACFEHATQIAKDELTWPYYQALAEYRANEKQQAVASLHEVLRREEQMKASGDLEQRYIPAHLRLGLWQLELGKTDEALKTFERLEEIVPESPVALYGLGRCAAETEQWQEAREYLEQAIEAAPSLGAAHLALAEVYDALDQPEKARMHRSVDAPTGFDDPIEAALLRSGFSVPTLIADARRAIAAGELDRAEEIVRLAVDYDPTGVDAREMHARLLLAMERFEAAERELRKIVSAAPDRPTARLRLAQVVGRMNRPDEAETMLLELLNEYPAEPPVLDEYCALMVSQRTPEKAVERLKTIAAESPDDARTQLIISGFLLQLDQAEASLAAVQRAIELDPELAIAHHRKGVILHRQGKTDEAAASCERALELAPSLLEARIALIAIAEENHNYARAIELARGGVNLQPNSATLHNTLAWYLAVAPDEDLRNSEEAVQLAEAAVRLSRAGRADCVGTLAASYAAAGRFDEAKRALTRAQQLATSANQSELLDLYNQWEDLFANNQPYVLEE